MIAPDRRRYVAHEARRRAQGKPQAGDPAGTRARPRQLERPL